MGLVIHAEGAAEKRLAQLAPRVESSGFCLGVRDYTDGFIVSGSWMTFLGVP